MGSISPKLLTLAKFVREHEGAIEADLSRFHNLTLDDLGTRRLTWKRLGFYLRHSPDSSALAVEVNGTTWTGRDMILADVFDVLASANWQRTDGKGSRPKPYPRPWDKKLPARQLTPEQHQRLLARGPKAG